MSRNATFGRRMDEERGPFAILTELFHSFVLVYLWTGRYEVEVVGYINEY